MVKRKISDCQTYAAPGHFDMTAMRIHGKEESGADKFWMGMSHFLPGGGADWDYEESPTSKVYFVLEGELTVTDKDGNKIVVGPMESIHIAPFEGRAIKNETNMPLSMLVVVNYPE
ncbi:MAG: cupin domain-containing protein [Lachnospiraceae bacterium]